jgi:hypothetical protein
MGIHNVLSCVSTKVMSKSSYRIGEIARSWYGPKFKLQETSYSYLTFRRERPELKPSKWWKCNGATI